MPFTFVDRVPSKLGRVKITPENGGAAYYAIVERADEPATAGTPLSAANLNEAQETLVYSTTTGTSTWKSVYIGPNGKDTNTGTQASPMATIKAAIRKYAKWHKTLDIYLLDGTYTESLGPIATDQCGVSIRSASEDKEKVTINTATELDCQINLLRLYNITINATATGIRPVIVNGGTLYAYNVRINVPTDSSASCINVYNGSTAWAMNCVLNGGTAAGIYGNQALLVRAYNCTSERTLYRGFYATNGSTIEYTPTVTATNMTAEATGGKCINLSARPGSVKGSVVALTGQYMTYDGLLMQWGTVTVTPSATDVATTAVVTFPIAFTGTPTVFLTTVTGVPENTAVGVVRGGDLIPDPKKAVGVTLTRSGLTSTGVNWLAIGPGA